MYEICTDGKIMSFCVPRAFVLCRLLTTHHAKYNYDAKEPER